MKQKLLLALLLVSMLNVYLSFEITKRSVIYNINTKSKFNKVKEIITYKFNKVLSSNNHDNIITIIKKFPKYQNQYEYGNLNLKGRGINLRDVAINHSYIDGNKKNYVMSKFNVDTNTLKGNEVVVEYRYSAPQRFSTEIQSSNVLHKISNVLLTSYENDSNSTNSASRLFKLRFNLKNLESNSNVNFENLNNQDYKTKPVLKRRNKKYPYSISFEYNLQSQQNEANVGISFFDSAHIPGNNPNNKMKRKESAISVKPQDSNKTAELREKSQENETKPKKPKPTSVESKPKGNLGTKSSTTYVKKKSYYGERESQDNSGLETAISILYLVCLIFLCYECCCKPDPNQNMMNQNMHADYNNNNNLNHMNNNNNNNNFNNNNAGNYNNNNNMGHRLTEGGENLKDPTQNDYIDFMA